MVAKKGEGTFSEVFKAQCVKNGKMAAMKLMKSTFESEDQVNSLREIQALRRLSPHPGVIKLIEVLYEEVCTVHEPNLYYYPPIPICQGHPTRTQLLFPPCASVPLVPSSAPC